MLKKVREAKIGINYELFVEKGNPMTLTLSELLKFKAWAIKYEEMVLHAKEFRCFDRCEITGFLQDCIKVDLYMDIEESLSLQM